jgi:hypothetical protein
MSYSADPKSEPSPRSGQGSLAALAVLTGLFTASTTAAVVLAFLMFQPRPAAGPEKSDTTGKESSQPNVQAQLATIEHRLAELADKQKVQAPRPPEEPYSQKGAVKVEQASGVVYYPVPYASPPHVTLTARSSRSYLLTKQDETGFTWTLNLSPKEIKYAAEELAKNPDAKPTPDELTWEAKGLRSAAGSVYPSLVEQKGTFTTNKQDDGEVYFPFPYASPPNITLEATGLLETSVTACTTTGFTWKASTNRDQTITWSAKGIKATTEQVAQQIKNTPAGQRLTNLRLHEESGRFNYDRGYQGEVFFARPFASPPNVELERGTVILTEITTTGFKWQDRHAPTKGQPYSDGPVFAVWKAKGAPSTVPPDKTNPPEKER